MRALLDVNVLVALLDADHVHHAPAWHWLDRNIEQGWATCPITQNGCLRIMSQPSYPNHLPASQVADHLRSATDRQYHEFWPDTLSLLNPANTAWHNLIGPKQLTDIYLLAMAVTNGGRFVSFDRRITPSLVPGARDDHYQII